MSFTETLQSITGKLLADCTDQVGPGTAGTGAAEECRPRAASHRAQAVSYQRRIPYWQAVVQQPHQSGAVR